MSTPRSVAISAMRFVMFPRPPLAWKIPCSYSKNARIVKREGAWNGLIPRYFVWNDIANLTRSSVNNRSRSPATEDQGLSTLTASIAFLLRRSSGPFQGDWRLDLLRNSLRRFSLTYFRKPSALSSPDSSLTRSVISSRSEVASMEPPCPKINLYDGSRGIRPNSLWASKPMAWKISSMTSG